MSVVKNKRNQSKVDFEMTYFQLADNIDNLIAHDFYAEGDLAENNRKFLDMRMDALSKLSDTLLYHIKIANSLYPTCMQELEERRTSMGKAIGTCYAILTHYQRIMTRLRVADDSYTMDIKVIMKMINSLKAWRKSDNKLKAKIEGSKIK